MPDWVPLWAENTNCRPELVEKTAEGGLYLRSIIRQSESRVCPRPGMELPVRESAGKIVLISTGWAARVRNVNGRAAILDTYLPHDMAGLDSAVATGGTDTFVTLSPVTYLTLDFTQLHELMNGHTGVALHVLWHFHEARRRADLLMTLSFMDAFNRLAILLTDFYDRLLRYDFTGRPSYNLPLTQSQIGDYLGLTNVHVSRMVRQLRERKLIYWRKQVIILNDLAALREIYRAMRSEPLNPGSKADRKFAGAAPLPPTISDRAAAPELENT